jgi:LacI family transcriptional regulator
LKGWDGDGVIARLESDRTARDLLATGFSVIDVSAALPRLAFPRLATDAEAAAKLAACRLAGLTVPDDVAVIGVHNDELLCELCDPRLSRVIPNGQRAGYEAAALLRRAMTGKPPPEAHDIRDLDVAHRRHVRRLPRRHAQRRDFVQHHTRERASNGANVSDVLRAVPMARTALERRFKAALGTTPHAQLRKLRMERVEELLVGMTLPVGGVVAATGFENPEYLRAMFRRECGLSSREFRARHGGGRIYATRPRSVEKTDGPSVFPGSHRTRRERELLG